MFRFVLGSNFVKLTQHLNDIENKKYQKPHTKLKISVKKQIL